MFKIKSRFYVIYGDSVPIYVGYTNRTVKQRFAEHKRSKDLSDYDVVEVKELKDQELSFNFTWNLNVINDDADIVSKREMFLIQQFNTQNSCFQKAFGGGQNWSDIKYFVSSNKNNPKFKGMSGSEIKRYLNRQRKMMVMFRGFVVRIRRPFEANLHDFIRSIKRPFEDNLNHFIGEIKRSFEVNLNSFINHIKRPFEDNLNNFVHNIKRPVEVNLSNFIGNIKRPFESNLNSFISNIERPFESNLNNFVNHIKRPFEDNLNHFVGDIKRPFEFNLNSFISNIKRPFEVDLHNFVGHINRPLEDNLSNFVGNINAQKGKLKKKEEIV